jgi:arylformamidase
VVAQVEHIQAVENIEEILAVDGVDAFIVGPYDLSGSLDSLGDFKDKKMVEAMGQRTDMTKKTNVSAGFHVVPPKTELVKEKIEEGYTLNIKEPGPMIILSHPISSDTPVYGGGPSPVITPGSRMAKGDSCNTLYIAMTSHTGTHIDLPAHFALNGRTLTDYDAGFWFSGKVGCVFWHPDRPPEPGTMIRPQDLEQLLEEKDDLETGCKAVLLKTGFGANRGTELYWKNPPGIDPGLPGFLRHRFPSLRFFGMDLISVSSFASREVGRKTHRALLDHPAPILPIEDMDLTCLPKKVSNLLVAPLYLENGDGAPCTVFADIG